MIKVDCCALLLRAFASSFIPSTSQPGIMGLGLLLQTLFSINYLLAISIGVVIIVPYLLIGGYTTLAWLDSFQAVFLLLVIVIVPIVGCYHLGGLDVVCNSLTHYNTHFARFIPVSHLGKFVAIATFLSWGPGYFGQPHIITKFMGIRNPKEIKKSMSIGVSWQALTLTAAVAAGAVGVVFFKGTLANPEMVFVSM